MRVLAIDPGGATGLATWQDGDFRAWHVDGQYEALAEIERELALLDPYSDTVVMETFTINAATLKKSRGGSNTAMEIIGAVKWMCFQRGLATRMQSPADAKSFSTNEKLARAGFVTPSSPDHARSAARHLLLALAAMRAIDLSLLVR